ncbi:hypothetical protein PFISCL1PPCAC_12578, partial [Pristionchus fissidentatus]
LRFLVYSPMWGRSHVTFMGKLADVLVEAGHEVTLIGPIFEAHLNTHGTKLAKVIEIPTCAAMVEYQAEKADQFVANVWRAKSTLGFLSEVAKIKDAWAGQCNATLSHPGLIDQLREEKFDAAFYELMDMCAPALFHLAGIDKIAITLSMASFEGSFDYTGVPTVSSYIPGPMSSNSEKMTFLQRVTNFLSLGIIKFFFPMIAMPYQDVVNAKFGDDFPSLFELAQNNSLLFMNDEPLIEFPRLITHKIIDIGGITLNDDHEPLNETWSAIFDLRPQTVLFSLGTVARSYLMPEEYKQTLRETFRQFPDVTFIWKYEKPEHRISEGLSSLSNYLLINRPFLPDDPRLSLFITHCGQGSTTEATTAGVPLIVIPVLGDQKRNAQVIARINTGVVLRKEDLADGEKLRDAIQLLLTDKSFAERARQTGDMIRHRPFKPRETFVRNMEFLARYGPLRMLDHYGKNLNFFEYYLLDVFAFFAVIFSFVFVTLFLFVRFVYRCVRLSIGKQKSE